MDGKKGSNTFLQEFVGGDVWKKEIVNIIRDVVREELANYTHTCKFDVDDEKLKDIEHTLGIVSNLGQGNVGEGLEVIRDNHKWLKKQRERSDKLSTAFFIVLFGSIVSGVMAAIWVGFKHMAGR